MFPDRYHQVPVLGVLPAAFSSNGSVLSGRDICDTLLAEHSAHSGNDDPSMLFPNGAEEYISSVFSDVITYLLYECESIYFSYSSPLLKSVYGWNLFFGYLESNRVRDRIMKIRHCSLLHSHEDCVLALETLFDLLSLSIHISESMRLPLKITSKLFSHVSVLLSIPLSEESSLCSFMSTNPSFRALSLWGENINKGCKIWPVWPSQTIIPSTPKRESTVETKSNVVFLMSSAAVLFVYLATANL